MGDDDDRLRKELALRASGIGGSDVAPILGVGRYRTAHDVWRAKTGREEPGGVETRRSRLGRYLQDPIARLYARENNAHVVTGLPRVRRRDRPWQIGEVDGVILSPEHGAALASAGADPGVVLGGNGMLVRLDDGSPIGSDGPADQILEVKIHGHHAGDRYGSEDTDDVPTDVMLQTQWYLDLTGARSAVVIGVVDSEDRYWTVHRSEPLIAEARGLCERWWHDHVLDDVAPPADGSESLTQWLRARGAEVSEPRLATANDVDAVRRLALAKESLKRAQAEHDKAAQEVMAALETSTALICGDVTIATWKPASAPPAYKEALRILGERMGASDAEIAEAIEESRGDPIRKLLVKIDGLGAPRSRKRRR